MLCRFWNLETPKSPKSSTKGKNKPISSETPPLRPLTPVETNGVTNGVIETNGIKEMTEDEIIEQKRQLLLKGMLRGGNKKKTGKSEK